ncbi:MAG TPA: hypothetical protein PKN86_10530 [Candidatus Obscuribacter sp.]|nr:hypothetical protein [Candidatus Obscuribacter sp.]MBK9278077.1 hypothetical protein [Candidatus Obscuribacter sp.]HMW90446.1 hypothetical protein [Candidatus Obscuribacter sp.]HMX44803.1 hypothetical protein [Candidatus Obscuribacter sp.]HMY02763.1 hypothetical protein [Candidatus Obscuribacter sp.]
MAEDKQPATLENFILKKNPWLALTMGIIFGAFFHYVIFRLSLPTEPFIYAAF